MHKKYTTLFMIIGFLPIIYFFIIFIIARNYEAFVWMIHSPYFEWVGSGAMSFWVMLGGIFWAGFWLSGIVLAQSLDKK